MANTNPLAKASETAIVAARRKAAAKLLPLFGGKTAEGEEVEGAFHTYGIAAVVGESPDYATYVAELRENPHARAILIANSARGDEHCPPALVAEFLARPDVGEEESDDEEKKQKWFAEVFLGGLIEIHAATGVGLGLPGSQPRIDLLWSAHNVVAHLRDDEKKRLGLCKADESPRRTLAVGLLAVADEYLPSLTPAQRLYQWVMQRWDERQERRKSREKGGDVTAALPGATAPAEPLKSVVVIPGVAVQVQPPVPKSAKRPAPRKAPAPAATAPVIPGLTPAASAASESVPAPLDAAGVVAAVLEEGSDRAKAYALMLRKGSLPLEKAVALAKAEGLL